MAGNLSIGRYSPVGVVFGGTALIAAGYDFAKGAQKTSDVLDPDSGALSAGPNLARGRNFPAYAFLDSGALLVTGGFHPSFGSLPSAEILEPGATDFAPIAGKMLEGREAHTATRLPDGRVAVIGGLQASGFVFHSSAELFDPATRTFTATGSLSSPRAFHTATLLASGSILVIGGDSGKGELATAERFESGKTFVKTGNALARPAKALAAVRLLDGRVLVAGGANAKDGTLSDAVVYDSATDEFTAVGPMATRRIAFSLTLLADGRVLASGGFSDSTSPRGSSTVLEVFDPATSSWSTLPVALAHARHDHVAILLPDCRVLVAGGQQVVDPGAAVAPREVELLTVPRK